jgi:putative oxidoreductase
MKILTATNPKITSLGVFFVRCAIGIVLLMGGASKMLGWFHGFGPEMTIGFYKMMGFSKFWAYVSSYTELIGGLLLVVGLLTRPAAFALLINMTVAFIISLPNGFISENGASTPFVFMICVLAILVTGPLKYSIDWFAFRNRT